MRNQILDSLSQSGPLTEALLVEGLRSRYALIQGYAAEKVVKIGFKSHSLCAAAQNALSLLNQSENENDKLKTNLKILMQSSGTSKESCGEALSKFRESGQGT